MADYSISSYTADGTTTDFLLTFDYLDVTHLKVFIDGVSADEVGAGYSYSLVDSTTIRVTTDILDPVTSGKLIEIKRVTPIDTPAVTFNDGSNINGGDLNKNTNYLLFAMQESVDNIHETVAEGAALAQVATEGFRDEAEAFRDQAAASAAAAAASEAGVDADATAATTAATAAAASQTAAASSATSASTSATNAASSATSASTSASAASTSATSASTSATTAGTHATNAAASATSAGSSATSASSSASSASTSASSATTSKNAAATSATDAASSATAAATSATNAASSATSAGTSATNAANSASAAATSETNAATSAASAAASAASLNINQDVSTTGTPSFTSVTAGQVNSSGDVVAGGQIIGISASGGGAATNPAYTFAGQAATTGMFLPANGTLAFSTAGIERVRIVGNSLLLGTTDAATDLAYQTKLKLSGDGPALYLEETDTLQDYSISALGGKFTIRDATAPANRMVIDSSGNVGIGTNSPASALDVTGTVTADGLTVDTDTLYVDATTDRVGINTTPTATSALHVKDPTYTGTEIRAEAQNGEYSLFFQGSTEGSVGSTTDFGIYSGGSKIATFTTGGQMWVGDFTGGTYQYEQRIDTGDVAFMLRTMDATGNAKFYLRAGGDKNAYMYFGDGSSTSAGQIYYTGSNDQFRFVTAGSSRAALSASGLVVGGVSASAMLDVIGDSEFNGAIRELTYVVTGTTPALDPSNGTIQTWTLSGNSTPTDSLSAGESITLMIDDGTAYTITWPTMTWVNNAGAAPTLATSGYTVVALWKVGSTLYGALVGDGS